MVQWSWPGGHEWVCGVARPEARASMGLPRGTLRIRRHTHRSGLPQSFCAPRGHRFRSDCDEDSPPRQSDAANRRRRRAPRDQRSRCNSPDSERPRPVLARQSFGHQITGLACASGTRGHHTAICYAGDQTSSRGKRGPPRRGLASSRAHSLERWCCPSPALPP
jgi:hypothetical protein